jgi:hypothetical protein
MDFFTEFIAEITFGIVMNILFTLFLGLYKFMNMSGEQIGFLMERYPIKPSYGWLAVIWLVPFFGACRIFYELMALQRHISRGGCVFEYELSRLSSKYHDRGDDEL